MGAGRAGRASSAWALGGLGVRGLALAVYHRIQRDDVLEHVAALSYYFLFAVFPALLILTTLVGLTPGSDLMQAFLRYTDDVLPPDAARLVRETVDEMAAGARGGLLSLGLLGALWGASRGVRSIMTALNVAYRVTATRAWWRRQLVALALTLTFGLFTLLGLVVLVFGERVGHLLAVGIGLGSAFPAIWSVLQWPLAVGLAVLAIDLTYYLAPAARPPWRCPTPGAAFALGSWVLTSLGLRLYVANLGEFNATYGSLGAVILLLLWLYLTAAALLVGGVINSVVDRAGDRQAA